MMVGLRSQLRLAGRYRNGQWHVYDYQGFQEQSGSRRASGHDVIGTSHVQNMAHYRGMVEAGDSQVRTFLNNLGAARTTLPMRAMEDTPITQRGSASESQPQVGAEPTSINLQREVPFTINSVRATRQQSPCSVVWQIRVNN